MSMISQRKITFFSHWKKKQVREVLFSIMINVLEIRNPIKSHLSYVCISMIDYWPITQRNKSLLYKV